MTPSRTTDQLRKLGQSFRTTWWREWEWIVLLALVAAIYLPRLTVLTIRGEESRRATVGMEMMATGDWIVPRQQGDPLFPSARPPLQSWAMAGLGMLRSRIDTVAVRLPSVAALGLLVLLIYAYGRTFLSRFGAFAAAAVYATFGQVLELGQLGETDEMFTLFISGSLLVWHWWYVRNWPAAWTWMAGYLLAALGTLTKGPQAPGYFAASVAAYLLFTRRWRYALSLAHLAGIAVFVAVVGTWLLPYYWKVGITGVRHVFGGDVSLYILDWQWQSVVKHVARYPVKVLAGSLLPWSVLLFAYFSRDFRRAIAPVRDHVYYLAGAILVTFPTVWLAPGSHTRFFMPLYPCFALLIGLAIERCAEGTQAAGYGKLWRHFLSVAAAVMLAAGAAVLGASLWKGRLTEFAQPLPFAAVYLVVAATLGATVFCSRAAATKGQRVAAVLGVAAFLGITSVGVVTNAKMYGCARTAEEVAELKQKLPPDVKLISIGPIGHGFAYHYGQPIEMRKPYEAACATGFTYFCAAEEPRLDFPWEKVAFINCDRNQSEHPKDKVIVGRRLQGSRDTH